MSHAADRNLLFGILALQMDFITRDQLVAGMQAWVFDKTKPLGRLLVEQGSLREDLYAALDVMVQKHLEVHNNDPQQSLAAISPLSPLGRGAGGEGRSLRQELEHLADPEVQASLGHLAVRGGDEGQSQGAAADPHATRSAVGESSSAGLRFTILRPHAEGGLGKVSVALDEELHREVALKEIKTQHADDKNSRGRFLLEAEITGGLEHPGIVPVYGLGAYSDGRPFYAMRFIRGDSLKEAIDRFHKSSNADYADQRRKDSGLNLLRENPRNLRLDFSSLDFRELLRRFIDVCNAIAYAHSRGVLHRDLKPGNIMLGKYGETLVVDWGLAKATGTTASRAASAAGSSAASTTAAIAVEPSLIPSNSDYVETVAGSAIGTPAFMSPEQAAGRLDLLGPASDVYSLGATLYQLLTGEPPLKNVPSADLLRRVERGDIPPPRQLCGAAVPAALDAICRKAMSRDPSDRYVTPRALADDIEHWLADEPVSVFGEPWPVRAGRWSRKHKTFVTGAAAALLVAVISSITANVFLSEANETISKSNANLTKANETITQREKETREAGIQLAKSNEEIRLAYLKLEKEQKESEQARKLASDRADKIEDEFATSTMQLARSRFEENNAGLAVELLEKVPPKFRASAWKFLKNYMAASFDNSINSLRDHSGFVNSATFSPDGHIVASGSYRTVKLWDANTGQQIRSLHGHANGVTSVTFSPDGRIVASGSDDRTVKLWDAMTGKEIRALRGHTDSVNSVTFSPDGQVVASGSNDKTIRLWDARTGKLMHTFCGHTNAIRSVTFSPDGQIVASGGNDQAVKLWDAGTGQEIRGLRGHTSWISSVAFSPDGQVIASGSNDKTFKLWDARNGQEIRALSGHSSGVTSVTFSPDGQIVVSGSWDTTVKLWNARTGQEISTLRGHPSVVNSVTFSPNGQVFASSSHDKTVKLWDARIGQEFRNIRGHSSVVKSVSFSPDGRVVASGSDDQTVKLWDARSGQEIRTLRGHTHPVSSVTFSPNGQIVASGSADHTVKLWDASSGQEIRTLRGHRSVVHSVSFRPDGEFVVSGSADHTVKLWDSRTGQEIRALRGHTRWIDSVSFSPDGRHIASGGWEQTVKLWDACTGQEIRSLRGHTLPVTSVTFSPDGKVIASASADQTVRLWNARTGQTIHTLRGHTSWVTSVSFSPDSQLVASGSWDKTVKLWDVRTGQ